jgi:hypothetical protein
MRPERLSGYCPGTGSVEYLWSHWKQNELPNFRPQDFEQLKINARPAFKARIVGLLGLRLLAPAELFPCNWFIRTQ